MRAWGGIEGETRFEIRNSIFEKRGKDERGKKRERVKSRK
jgi:hypothetical protein